jgi:hypothetical protein
MQSNNSSLQGGLESFSETCAGNASQNAAASLERLASSNSNKSNSLHPGRADWTQMEMNVSVGLMCESEIPHLAQHVAGDHVKETYAQRPHQREFRDGPLPF